MKSALVPFVAMAAALSAAGCGRASIESGGDARVTIADQSYEVKNISLAYEIGDGGYFRIEGDDAAHPDQDCLPGLAGGLALYGDLPSSVTSLADVSDLELPFEFSGDGDDRNLCFVGSNGLLGVETGTVRFGKVEGTRVAFSFSGSFTLYDGEGGEASSKVIASGDGIARVATN